MEINEIMGQTDAKYFSFSLFSPGDQISRVLLLQRNSRTQNKEKRRECGMEINEITGQIIDATIKIHKQTK